MPFTIVLISRISTMVNGTLLNFGKRYEDDLTDGIFETGAYGVPSKSQNPTILGQSGPSCTQCSNLAGHDVGTIRLAPTTVLHFNTAHKTKYLFPH